jgi:DNA-binding transcriptional MerR regulator
MRSSYDMSYPQYSVHDVSDLTGISPQTVRYYDRMGVVVPQRGAQGQRLYSYYDVLNLVRRNLYKAEGFTLQETEQLLSGTAFARLPGLLKEKREAIERERLTLRLAEHNLDRLTAQLDRLRFCRGRVMLHERPACWRVPYSRGGHICFEEASTTARARYSSAFAFSFSVGTDAEPDACMDWDMTMDEPFAGEIGFSALPGAFFVPARCCLYTVIATHGMDFLRREALQPLFDYAAEQQMIPEGTIYGRDIAIAEEDADTLRWYEAWLPVK